MFNSIIILDNGEISDEIILEFRYDLGISCGEGTIIVSNVELASRE